MRILLLNYEYPPLGGGAAKALENMVRAFMTLFPELEVDIVAASAGAFEEERLNAHIRVFKLDVGKKGDIHYQHTLEILRYLFQARTFSLRLLRERKYDLVHAFFAVPSGLIAWLLRKKLPYLVSLRGSDVPYFNDRFRFLYPFLSPFLRIILNRAGGVTANSALLQLLANGAFPGLPISIIPNGVNTTFFVPLPASRPEPPLNILFVGRLIQRKGVEYLLDAFAQLRTSHDAMLIIAGTGNLDVSLKNKAKALGIQSRVHFLGEIRGKALLAAYQSAHMFVLPSLNEGMSNALLEAMACGLPVIVTDTGGTQELICGNGIVVGRKSAEDIHSAMEKLSSSPELRKEMGERSRVIAESMSWDNTARQYQKQYLDLLAGKA